MVVGGSLEASPPAQEVFLEFARQSFGKFAGADTGEETQGPAGRRTLVLFRP